MTGLIEKAKALYGLDDHDIVDVPGHEGGRNLVFICVKDGNRKYALRISVLDDRAAGDYLEEAEFVHYLAEKGAPVADVIPSLNGNYVESFSQDQKEIFVILFEYAKGMLISDNGYRYREGAPLEEYFYNTGKALGAIHRLSKEYNPEHKRQEFFDKYNPEYIDELVPDSYGELKRAIKDRLEEYHDLPVTGDVYGLVHFDFSDGNYNIDMNTGDITVYDFDNCIYCWYMFDLAHLWTHGIGWCRHEADPNKRKEFMDHYFETILKGYRSETDVSDEMLDKLPLFIDMTLIEYIIDEFECCAREGEEPDREDIEIEEHVLINNIPYAGFC